MPKCGTGLLVSERRRAGRTYDVLDWTTTGGPYVVRVAFLGTELFLLVPCERFPDLLDLNPALSPSVAASAIDRDADPALPPLPPSAEGSIEQVRYDRLGQKGRRDRVRKMVVERGVECREQVRCGYPEYGVGRRAFEGPEKQGQQRGERSGEGREELAK